MSSSAQVIATRASQGDQQSPVRGSIPSSSIEAMSPRRISEQALEPLGTTLSPTSCELYDIKVEFDHQCLQQAAGIHLAHRREQTSNDSVRAWAETLSGPLNQTGCPERDVFLEIQLRALVSSLALLHHSGVHTLDSVAWTKLNTNISERFRAIAYQLKPQSTLAQKIRHTSNVYAVQLASQYLSFIQCGDSKVPSLAGPVVKILFASIAVANGQYDRTQQILEGFNQLFALRQKPQTKFEALCGLQEYARLATSLTRESFQTKDREQVRKAAAVIVMTLLLKLDKILIEEDSSAWPDPGTKWHKLLAAIQWNTPDLDRGWYYFGLLDCAAQLAALVEPAVLPQGFVGRIKKLIFRKASLEYRWKAMEILMSCGDTRMDQYNILTREIKERPEVEAYEPGEEPRERLLEMAKTVRSHLTGDEENELRFRVSPPLAPPHDEDVIQSSSPTPLSPSTTSGPPDLPEEPWKEPELDTSTLKPSRSFAVCLPRNGIRRTSYNSAGFSEDCRHAFFYNNSEISVFHLGDLGGYSTSSPPFPRVFAKQVKGEHILNVVLAHRFLLIVTNKRLLTIDITMDERKSEMDTTPHQDWDPSGLACHEDETHMVIILGQRKFNHKNGHIGRLKVIKRKINSNTRVLSYSTVDVPGHDFPKKLGYDPNAQLITCITKLRNKVIVWELNEEFIVRREPFEHINDRHIEETKATGGTSVSVYKSPTDRLYALCTTAPSTERSEQQGEWSFIVPLPNFTAPRYRTPNKSGVHDLEQFKSHRALRAGCVSSVHNVFAVLEETGKIWILPLEAHEEAGIDGSRSDALVSLPESLCNQDMPSTSSFRFDPSGDRLFAIDPRGKIVVSEFEKQEG